MAHGEDVRVAKELRGHVPGDLEVAHELLSRSSFQLPWPPVGCARIDPGEPESQLSRLGLGEHTSDRVVRRQPTRAASKGLGQSPPPAGTGCKAEGSTHDSSCRPQPAVKTHDRRMQPEGGVAAEELITAEAGERDLEPLAPHESGDTPGIEPVDRGEVEGGRIAPESLLGLLETNDPLMVLGPEVLCRSSSERGLVELWRARAHRERMDLRGATEDPPGHRQHCGRVDSPAEEDADRDVAQQVSFDCLLQGITQEWSGRSRPSYARRSSPSIVAPPHPSSMAVLVFEALSWKQLMKSAHERRWRGYRPPHEKVADARRVERRVTEESIQGASLRREHHRPVSPLRIEERFDSEAIHGDQPCAVLRTPETESEHSGEARQEGPPRRVQVVQQHLGIGGTDQLGPTAQQLIPKLVSVVDLAVEGERRHKGSAEPARLGRAGDQRPIGELLEEHWLCARRVRIEDCEPRVNKLTAFRGPGPLTVGPSVAKRGDERFQAEARVRP